VRRNPAGQLDSPRIRAHGLELETVAPILRDFFKSDDLRGDNSITSGMSMRLGFHFSGAGASRAARKARARAPSAGLRSKSVPFTAR